MNRYIPQYNESEFGRIAKRADAYYAGQRRKSAMIDIVERRNALLRERYNLRSKSRRTIEEDKRLSELDMEIKEIMLKIGRK
jgi:hypothetical protein